jgi:tetratricopeptide (TPR) repeat protein/predicted Ser/Thr protein kinase
VPATACLDEEQLLRFVLHQLTDEEVTRAEAHLRTCPTCRRAIALLAETETGDPPPPPVPSLVRSPDLSGSASDSLDAPMSSSLLGGSPRPGPSGPKPARKGKQIDRYVVLDVLGAGSMGVVYTAFDPELDRKIALKMLRGDSSDPELAMERRARMMREAQAMARLSHLNVVRVHDVGTYQDQIFLAMELVQGQSLTDWLKAQKRTWREVLRVFIQAGRGLAAAHAAGLVHRDFKPDNILLGEDGVVRVMDFGLVQSVAPDPNAWKTPTPLPLDRPPEEELANPLTRTGALLGTPAYMAPEQWMGDKTDARADQFSFCVSLYEALYGERPFSAVTLAELTSKVAQGMVNEIPASSVPFYVRRAVLKGLAPDPALRHASMDELLRLLERGLRVPPRRLLYTGAALLGLSVVASALPFYLDRRELARCTNAETIFAGVWDGPTRAALQAAYTGAQVPYAQESWERTAKLLDLYRARWERIREVACDALHLGDEPEDMARLRVECLDARVDDFRALVEVLGQPDRQVVDGSVLAASRLASPEECAVLRALAPAPPPPQQREARERIHALRLTLARSRAQAAAGRHGEAARMARTALAEAEQVGHRPAEAEALLALGDAQQAAAELDHAQASFSRALLAAEASGHQKTAAAAAVKLVEVHAALGQPEQSEFFASMASAHLERMGGDDALRAKLAVASARRLLGQQQLARAEARLMEALGIQERLYGAEHPDLSEVLRLLGGIRQQLGRGHPAVKAQTRALEVLEAALGPGHPWVADQWAALGGAMVMAGRQQDAVDHFRRALELLERTRADDHPKLAAVLVDLSRAELTVGLSPQAVEHARRALALRKKVLGAWHPETGSTSDLLGTALLLSGDARGSHEAHLEALRIAEKARGPEAGEVPAILERLAAAATEMGRYAEAEGYARRALSMREKADGAGKVGASGALTLLADLMVRTGRVDAAAAGFRRVLALRETAFGEESPRLVAPLMGLARCALLRRRLVEAEGLLERVMAIDRATPMSALERADAGFLLAQALEGVDSSRAEMLASTSKASYERAGLTRKAEEVARWQAKRPPQ